MTRILTLWAILLAAIWNTTMAAMPRTDYGAKLEPHDGVLTGAGQVEPADVLAYTQAVGGQANPVIFMDYVDVHPENPDAFFDALHGKLDKLPWYAVPQIGLGFNYPDGKPYDVAAAEGKFDANLKRICIRLASFGRPVYLRIAYEFHGSWNAYTPEAHKAVFRKVRGFLKDAGARDVATVWCAEAGSLPADYAKFYPGDDVVDWWGIDIFDANDCANNPAVAQFMKASREHRKPIMIGESTPRHVSTLNGQQSWDGWFVPYFRFIDDNANVKAFCYINWDWAIYAKLYGTDWGDWGDCRLQQNAIVSRLFTEQMRRDFFIKSISRDQVLKAIVAATPGRSHP